MLFFETGTFGFANNMKTLLKEIKEYLGVILFQQVVLILCFGNI